MIPQLRNSPLLLLPRRFAVLLIALYQNTLSPDHGPLRHLYPYGYCRHEPTCSEYGKQVITNKGVVIGGILTLWRILRCNPFTKLSDEKLKKIITDTSQ